MPFSTCSWMTPRLDCVCCVVGALVWRVWGVAACSVPRSFLGGLAQDPVDDGRQFRVGRPGLWRHRDRAPHTGAALADLVGQVLHGAGVALVLGGDVLEG